MLIRFAKIFLFVEYLIYYQFPILHDVLLFIGHVKLTTNRNDSVNIYDYHH